MGSEPIKIKEVFPEAFITGHVIGFLMRFMIFVFILSILKIPHYTPIAAMLSLAVPFIVRYYNGRTDRKNHNP